MDLELKEKELLIRIAQYEAESKKSVEYNQSLESEMDALRLQHVR